MDNNRAADLSDDDSLAVKEKESRITIPALGRPGGRRAGEARADGESWLVRGAVRGARRGETECIHFLYVRFASSVLERVAEIVADGRSADAVTQAIFVSLPEALPGCEENGGYFETWLLEHAASVARRRAAAPRGPADGD